MLPYPQHPCLSITEDGRVYSTRTNRFLKTHVNKNGYVVLSTKFEGRKGPSVCLRVHRLVAELYVLNTFKKPFVNHKDGNKQNNLASNLEWVTTKENAIHASLHGLLKPRPRDQNKQAKLTSAKLLEISQQYIPRDKNYGLRALASKYGVSHSILSRLVQRGGLEPPSLYGDRV